MCSEKISLNNKLNGIYKKIKDPKLKCLFKCFYYNLENDTTTLNIALNVFFGNFNEIQNIKELNNEDWQEYFKSSIKERYSVTKKGVTKYKLKDPDPDIIGKLDINDYIKPAKNKWNEIKKSLNCYFIKLNNNNNNVEKTLIYEAPPYLLSIDKKKNINFEAEFIFDENCSSPYVNAIRKCFNKNKVYNLSDILIEKNVGFFDVIPIPIPINSDLREQWATDQKFKINKKRIFVYFFEWALEIYLFRLGKKSINVNHKIAIGIPLKNAVSIYEHAQNKAKWPRFKLDRNFCDAHNFNETNKKPDGLWVQPYKNCIIGSSNTPSGDLMKLAFEINI